MPTVRSLIFDGIKYSANSSSCLVLDFMKELPVFVQTKYILQLEGNWHLCVKTYLPIKYISTACAYEVECQPAWLVVQPHDLFDSHQHRMYRKNNKTYAYTVFDVSEYSNILE